MRFLRDDDDDRERTAFMVIGMLVGYLLGQLVVAALR
jgi:hypothetical protein